MPRRAKGLTARAVETLREGYHADGGGLYLQVSGTGGRSWIFRYQHNKGKRRDMGLGPVYCATAILKRHQLALGDIELWELNEAFAAQVLGCLAAWDDDEFCRDALGLPGAAGKIVRDRLNVDGGAIGVGHPVGASGNRIVLHVVNAMKRLGYRRGIATECIGGGQGGAMLIEAV